MSGPKVDAAELRRREQEELERQRQERLRLIRLATDKYMTTIDTAKKAASKVSAYLQYQITELANNSDVISDIAFLDALKKDYSFKLSLLTQRLPAGEASEIEQAADNLSREIGAICNQFDEAVEPIEKALNNYLENDIKLKESNAFSEKLASVSKRETEEFVEYFDDIASGDENIVVGFGEQVSAFCESVKSYLDVYTISESEKRAINGIVDDIKSIVSSDISDKRKAERLLKCNKEFNLIREMIMHKNDEMHDLYCEYLTECLESEVTPKEERSFNTSKQLESEIKRVKKQATGKMQRKYIIEQIDDVMRKYGIDITDNVILAPVEKGVKKLYGIKDDVAINVFVSEGNSVTMSVVTIGDNTSMTDDEDEKLYMEQCAFCSMHPQIVKDLAARGVILNMKKRNAPSKAFNKKIETKSGSVSSNTSGSTKKKSKSTVKKMTMKV